jgi:nucleoside-diphosphate-sugar epimerase
MKLPADKVARLRPFYHDRVICVTGGAGFIGGHLCDALVSLGAKVRVIDDLSNSSLDHLATLIDLDPDSLRMVHGSILDEDALAESMQDAKTVFHLAAVGSVPRSIEQPQRSWTVNATGTLRVLEMARKVGAQRVMLAASSSAYGDVPQLPREESMATSPMSPYAASKLAGEQLMTTWSKCYGLSTVSLRYFNIFGPRQSPDSAYAAVVAAFAKALLSNTPPTIYGDGRQTRDMTFVSNAVLATLLAGASTTPFMGEVMNVGTGGRVSVLELAERMATLCGVPHLRPLMQPERSGEVKHSQADISKAKHLLGYEPVATLEAGLAETVEWFRAAMAQA